MGAGLLAKTFIQILRNQNIQTESGSIKKQTTVIHNLRARKMKENGSIKKEENGKELFDSYTVTFQIRYVPDIYVTDTLLYNNQEFKISLIERDVWDNTLKIHCTLINK